MSNRQRRKSQVIVWERSQDDLRPQHRNVRNFEIEMNFESDNESAYSTDAQRTSAFTQARLNSQNSDRFETQTSKAKGHGALMAASTSQRQVVPVAGQHHHHVSALSSYSSGGSSSNNSGNRLNANGNYSPKRRLRWAIAIIVIVYVGYICYDVFHGFTQQMVQESTAQHQSNNNIKGVNDQAIGSKYKEYKQHLEDTRDQLHIQNLGTDETPFQSFSVSHKLQKQQLKSTQSVQKQIHQGVSITNSGQRIKQQTLKDEFESRQYCSKDFINIYSPDQLILDSDGTFCELGNLDEETSCCSQALATQNSRLGIYCNPFTKCCATQADCTRDCMLHSNQQEQFDSLANQYLSYAFLGLQPKYDLGNFQECKKSCRVTANEINHNRYYNSNQHYCWYDSQKDSPSDFTQLTIAKNSQSCDDACSALPSFDLKSDFLVENLKHILPFDSTLSDQMIQKLESNSDLQYLQYQCSEQELQNLNTCEFLVKYSQNNKLDYCQNMDFCTAEFEPYAPAFLTNDEQNLEQHYKDDMVIDDSKSWKRRLEMEMQDWEPQCVVASHKMLLNCDTKGNEQFDRMCACLPQYPDYFEMEQLSLQINNIQNQNNRQSIINQDTNQDNNSQIEVRDFEQFVEQTVNDLDNGLQKLKDLDQVIEIDQSQYNTDILFEPQYDVSQDSIYD